jgi:hypothetical protein
MVDRNNVFRKVYFMKTDTKAILARLCIVWNVTTYKELADLLNAADSTVSSWGSKDTIPFKQCLYTTQQKGCSMDWLIFGVEAPVLFEAPLESAINSVLTTAYEILLMPKVEPSTANSIARMTFLAYKEKAKIDDKAITKANGTN